ncbi:High-affinity branched-chain amino acid transport system permease protein LivH [Candidatus Izimaplasma bacterium HR1]|jgi:branched-chain amino acid transport system permease protein|uniref:branched-chain amino acid ABC transporter permease n=1 Tax=Candidatus Izimoplasma sp. HR1 TaxID=1541959 RepID=UPI0004F72C12|nr:High-affinity branched-chain amino acid transport system permease protein LivH [Candidatus Izimaplasma bacterium HR1]
MSVFFKILFNSLESGSVYALAALGIVLIFRTSKTTNFAQGSIGTLNAFVAATLFLSWGWSIWAAALISIVTAFITGVLIDRFIIRPASKASAISKQIITLGLIMIIIGLIPMLFGVDPLKFDYFIAVSPATQVDIFGAVISYNTLFIITVTLGLMGFLFWFLQYTKWGLAIRVTASNEVTSRLMGVPTKNVTMATWAFAAIFGTLAALFIAPAGSVNSFMMTDVQVNAFFACVLGGFGTFYGAVIGAYMIALAKNSATYYISLEWGNVIVYVIILLLLYIKPNGLFGKKTQKKV